ncbi:PCMP-E8, partial [Symbiodinium necroappetens]
ARQGGRWAVAEALLSLARRRALQLDSFSQTGLMDSHSRLKRWEAALRCFHRRECGRRSVFEFNCALQACALGAKPGWAVAMLRDLRQSGHEPDAVTWSTVLTASRRHWKLTMGLLTQLRREVAWCRDSTMAIMESPASLRSYLSATNAALGSCALHRRWQHSVDLLEALARFAAQPSPRTYTTCFAALGAGETPWQLTVRLLSVGHHQSSLRDASLLADAAARSAARRSEWQVALVLLGAHWRGPLEDAALLDCIAGASPLEVQPRIFE